MPILADEQRILNAMLSMLSPQDAQEEDDKYEFSTIPVSAITIEKINQNLFKASEIHEENSRKSWSEASRYYAAK